jgi:hypothetical protein
MTLVLSNVVLKNLSHSFIYQYDSRFSGLLDFLQQWSEVVRVGVQLPHRDLDAVKRAEK